MAFTERYATAAGAGAADGTSEANAWSLATAVTTASAGQRVNVKTGTYSGLSTLTISVAGSDTQAIHWRAYTTTPGDGGRVTLTFSAGAYLAITGRSNVLEGFDVVANLNGDAVYPTAQQVTLIDCTITNSNANGYGYLNETGGVSLIRCAVKIVGGNSRYGICVTGNGSVVYGCFVRAPGVSIGIRAGNLRSFAIMENIVVGDGTASGIGIRSQAQNEGGATVISRNSLYNWATGITLEGLTAAANATQLCVMHNILDLVATGIHMTTGSVTNVRQIYSNAIRASSAAYSGFGDAVIPGQVTLTACPFVDPADFSGLEGWKLNNVAGGGALVRRVPLVGVCNPLA